MAVFLKATYSKKLGLPQYSSHQYTVEVSAELTDVSQLAQASAELYDRLQQAVDSQIINPGFMPGETSTPRSTSPGAPLQRAAAPTPPPDGEAWRCSEKQRDLILKIVDEHRLDKNVVDALARERFGCGVRELNKAQASGLIDELIETYGKTGGGRGQGDRHSDSRPSFQGRGRR